MSKGVVVNLRKETSVSISLWCSGKLLGWVSATTSKDALTMARIIVEWFGIEYDHDKHGALMELTGGEDHLKKIIREGKLR